MPFALVRRKTTVPWIGEEVDAFVRRVMGSTVDDLERHFQTSAGGQELWPEDMGDWMRNCQKPFQLWNVERMEIEYGFELDVGPELRVGRACAVPLGLPRPEKASVALAAIVEDGVKARKLRDRDQWMFQMLMRSMLPFGRPDDEDGPLVE